MYLSLSPSLSLCLSLSLSLSLSVSLSLSLSLSLSASLSLSLSLSLAPSPARSLLGPLFTDCIHYMPFIFHFFSVILNGVSSVSCVYLDAFVMRPASSGTPGSHSSAGNFPRLTDTQLPAGTPPSRSPQLFLRALNCFCFGQTTYAQTDSRYRLRAETQFFF